MSVTVESLTSQLISTFNIPFLCKRIDERSCRFEIAISSLKSNEAFSVICYRPYKNSCRSSLSLGGFSRGLISHWGDDADRLAEAFNFVNSLSPKIDFRINILGNLITDPDTLANAIKSVKSSRDIAIGCICRNIPHADEDEYFYLTAIACTGFCLIASSIYDDQRQAVKTGEYEGARSDTLISKYERSRSNRARCIAHYGTSCQVCGFDFGKTYGRFAEGHIEVHHITPLSTLNEPTRFDPTKDLIPLCSNCHAAVHLTAPPIHPDKLKKLIEQHRAGGNIG